MLKHITLAAALMAAGISASHAAEPLFQDNGAPRRLSAASATAAGSPFAGDLKVRAARVGLHVNPAATAASELSVPLPDGRQFNAKRFTSYTSASGATVWVGKHTADPIGTAASAAEETVLVVRDGKVTGSVRHEGKLYRIRSAPDGSHGVAEIDASKFPRDHVEAEYKQQVALSGAPQRISAAAAVSPMLADTPVIRVLVNYTPAAKASTSNMAGLIDLAIAETNQGYVNAGVNARVELAHSAQVSYNESGSNGTDRSRYASTDDRVMDEIHAQRNTYLADVSVLLTDGNDGCGNGSIYASASSAFATVTADCATGNYSFGHELGHVFGARHNPEEDSTSTPYPYGHGYLAPSGKWRTIMAYNCSNGCPRLNYWSNPNKTRDGVAMGTATKSNNARVLNERAAVLAAFRAAPPSNTGVSVTNSGDYTIPDNNSTGVSSPVSVSTPGNAGSVTLDVNIIHPYVGDLVVDLIAPDNTVYNLHNRSGGSANNIQRSFSVNAGAKPRVGTWKLRARDLEGQDNGHIESWTFKSQ